MTESDARAQRKRDARGLEPCPPGYLAIALGLQTLMTFLTAFLVSAPMPALAYSRTFAATGRIALTAVNPDALQKLSPAIQALASEMTKAQAQQALLVAASILAWAATEEEAADWARVLVTLLARARNEDVT